MHNASEGAHKSRTRQVAHTTHAEREGEREGGGGGRHLKRGNTFDLLPEDVDSNIIPVRLVEELGNFDHHLFPVRHNVHHQVHPKTHGHVSADHRVVTVRYVARYAHMHLGC